MFLAYDIDFVNETSVELNSKLEEWRYTIEYREFRLSRSKTEYQKCGFSGVEKSGEEVTLGGVAITKAEKFRYLESIRGERRY